MKFQRENSKAFVGEERAPVRFIETAPKMAKSVQQENGVIHTAPDRIVETAPKTVIAKSKQEMKSFVIDTAPVGIIETTPRTVTKSLVAIDTAPVGIIETAPETVTKSFVAIDTAPIGIIETAPRTLTSKPKLRGYARLRKLNSMVNGRFKLLRRNKRKVEKMSRMPNLISPSKVNSPGYLVAKMLTKVLKKDNNSSWKQKFRQLKRYKSLVRRITLFQAQKVFIFGRNNNLVDEFVRILVNSNSNRPNSVKFLSPKLLSVVNDDENYLVKLFSPSFLGLQEENEAILSLPHLLQGLNTKERDAWLELIMQASGAQDSVDKVLEYFKNPTPKSDQEKIFLSTLNLADGWQRIQEKNNIKQQFQLENDGFTFLEKDQLVMLYGKSGLYNISEDQLDIDLETYGLMSEDEREEALENTLRSLAGEGVDPSLKSWNRRLKQTTLAPYAFAPGIFAPGVLGPITLSPFLFSPVILSPVVLSPITLSPGVGNAVILSPYVLGPTTLSPQVMTPFILSPYVLSPNILNPYVLSPLILSPYVLSPDILSPAVLGGTILSPYVLSPAILNPGVLNADVLSPSVLS